MGLRFALLLLLAAGTLGAQPPAPSIKERSEVPQMVSRRPLIGDFSEGYVSYAHTGYENYDTFLGPRPWRYLYDSFGNLQMGGEELYSWVQHTTTDRLAEQRGGGPASSGRHFSVFDQIIAIGREDHKGRAAKVIISAGSGTSFYDEGIITRYSPLVINQIGLRGVRTDLSTSRTGLSLITATRYQSHRQNDNRNANDSGILLGGRLEREVGFLRFGTSFSNQHLFDFRRNLGGLKGDLPSSHAIPTVIALRISDDSRADGRGGPVVLGVKVYINGRERPDIVPGVVRQSFANDFTAVGRTSFRGEFRRDAYYDPDLKRVSYEYQGMEIPLYADYFYFRDYLKDPGDSRVQENTNLGLLTQSLSAVSLNAPQRADGEDYLMYYIDLEGEPQVHSARIDLLIGNDYRVEIAQLDVLEPSEQRYQNRYSSPFFATVERAAGNIQDLSNLQWISVEVGANTGQTLYGFDLRGNLQGLEIRGEFARGATHYRYPSGVPGSRVERRGEGPVLKDWEGERFAVRDDAFYLTLHREGSGFGFGAELFSVGPNYQTQMRLRPGDQSISYNPRYLYQQIKNNTTFFNLVDDNDDYDGRVETVLRGTLREPDRAVFPAQDEDNDGVPDINRNLNELPDFLEPFLMYDVDPNEFDWGLDLNNNGEIDIREDDLDPDLPYDKDLRGGHLFGRLSPAEHMAVTLGSIDAAQLAGGGAFAARYGQLSYRREQPGLGALRAEYELKRVWDSVPDDVLRWSSVLERDIGQATQELIRLQRFFFSPQFFQDPLEFRNSLVNRFYLQARFTRIPGLHLENKIKFEVNRQFSIDEDSQVPQAADWIDFLTVASKVDYTWEWRRLSATPQAKFRLLRRTRSNLLRPEADERTFIPILKLRYRLTERTELKAGAQGFPFLKYRVEDRADRRNSFEQRTYLLILSNVSKYAGYDLSTNIGINMEKRKFTDPFRVYENTDATGAFVRVFLGFGETTLY